MQKHRTKQYRGDRRKWQDANYELPESTRTKLLSLLGGEKREGFSAEYLGSEYLSKFCLPDAASSAARKSAAIEKWKQTEKRNAETNRRLRGRDRGYNILPRVSWYSFLEFAQHLIADVLGPINDEVVLGQFSGGASTSRKRSESHPTLKFTGRADVTKEARVFVDLIHSLSPLLRQYGTFFDLRSVAGAMLFTVPKKSDIDRCACKEPDINMFLQKGVGQHIRRRLRRFGQNLNDQSINRNLARLGSIDGSLATLDLSSASDTITISCVQALLPSDWFEYLNDIRSLEVEVYGESEQTQMFSSMGNGFTFELESLIFWALARTVAYFEGHKGIISVYGDDIIIPSGMYDMTCWVLNEFGFLVNPDKSFAQGPFRESCGGHYHSGVDVTPFYLRRMPTRLTDLIRVANQLRAWLLADPYRQFEYPDLVDTWFELKSLVPKNLWGGRDYAVDTQLVSPEPPNQRLSRLKEVRKGSELGAYLAWHVNNWNRSGPPQPSNGDEDHSYLTDTTLKCRLRRAAIGTPVLRDEFLTEIIPNSSGSSD